MDPELFNQFGSMVGGSVDSGTGLDTVPTPDVMQQAVDSSGNSLMPLLPTAMAAGGSILSAFGDIMAGNESQQADNYNATLALEQGQFEVQGLGEEETGNLSTQRAMYAKAGVTMSGSPLDAATASATQFEMSKQIATYNAQSQENMDIYEGQVAKQQGEFNAADSLLSGAENIGMAALLA